MIDYVTGKIADLSPTRAVVDNNGIGYTLEISLQTYSELEGKKEAKLYVQHQLNQRDGITVDYGFSSPSERELFQQITSVSGMGAASARMILSSLSSSEFKEAILAEDINKLKAIKGIGLKSAQRIVLELKDKVCKVSDADQNILFKPTSNEAVEEATQALIMLGFTKVNINKSIQEILKKNPTAKVEEIIKNALKMM